MRLLRGILFAALLLAPTSVAAAPKRTLFMLDLSG